MMLKDNAGHVEATHEWVSNQLMAAKGFLAAMLLSATGILLALTLAFGIGFTGPADAYAADQQTAPSAQADEQSGDASSDEDQNASDSQTAEAEEEQIEDDENPQSSGLGGGEPISGVANPGTVAIVGILAVAVIFIVVMRRLNGSIKRMNGMFK